MKNYVKTVLVISMFCISLGGLWIHYFMHSPAKHAYGYVPLVSGIISAFLIPVLFMFRKTLNLAYILNGFTCIVGFITMTHFSLMKAPLVSYLLILVCKFLLGRAIFCVEVYSMDAKPHVEGRHLIRYPNMGFWYVHLALLSVVYALGNILWR